jgi:hypothetical protein
VSLQARYRHHHPSDLSQALQPPDRRVAWKAALADVVERIENDWAGRNEVISAPPVLENGALLVPTAPGLGVDINEEAVGRYPSERNVSIAGGGYLPGTEGEHVYVQTRFGRAAQLRPKPKS